jgi:hypothetical protein
MKRERKRKMLKKMLFIDCAVLLIPVCANAAWTTAGGGMDYDFFHVAVRDYNSPSANADGVYNPTGPDHVRYGFNLRHTSDGSPVTDTSQYFVTVNGDRDDVYQVQGYLTRGSYNNGDTSFSDETYYRSRFRPTDPSSIHSLDLWRNDGGVDTHIVTHTNVFNLPNASEMRPYNGPSMHSLDVTFNATAQTWDFSWDVTSDPGYESNYRFTMYDRNNYEYEIIRKFEVGDGGVSISADLLDLAGSDSLVWAVQMQERFRNGDETAHNWNWLRSYSVEVDFSQAGGLGAVPTPIPGAAWLFASGLFGLVAVRRKKMMN